MTVDKKFILPFNIKTNSEVTGGYADQLHTEFFPKTEITNYHEDKYRIDEDLAIENVLQSPFTERWVGGRSYRHVSLNTGSDTSATRQEGYHIELSSNTISLYSHIYRNSPPAYWTREEFTKRPVNIKNVHDTELYVGNYSKGYEVLQTSGRRITNNLIVDGFEASGSLTTQFVFGENNYTLPDLTATGETVIVERFNAPGSKEESSRGALDREGEEMSPNIPLPFRNIKIRQPFYSQLAQHTAQFGSGSTYALLPATGSVNAVSIHKVNRNRLVRAGVESFDNWFVQHSIPRTDIQYSWITASSNTTAGELGGYQSFLPANSTSSYYNVRGAYTDIDFVSGSNIVGGLLVDNLYIGSYVKADKTINLNTNTFSITSTLSASFSEYTNSPYTFTSWTSLRNGETPVARALRKNNIVSILNQPKRINYKTIRGRLVSFVPKRGDSTTNYTDPPVTFKYRPLKHDVKLAEDATQRYTFEHEYTNTLSTFANKSLLEKLGKEDDGERFYDLLMLKMKESGPFFYVGHQYKEIVWPREENTGLNETRKRAAYYLDQPGFTRDGYDIQLGTQRAYWRDEQQDRKRSLNSEGGYYSSINYLSTEETGSNFTQNETGVLSNNKFVTFDLTFVQDADIDSGLFNSIALMESSSAERELFSYSGKVSAIYNQDLFEIDQIYNSINRRGYVYDVSGEFNNTFGDFYEQTIDTTTGTKKSLGALYRNTSYKALLNSLPENRSSYDDFAAQTEDEEVFANPKLKYVAFPGGGELNTGSFIQDELNFTNSTGSYSSIIDKAIYGMTLVNSDIYVAGEFQNIGDVSANRVAKWDGEAWSALDTGLNGTGIGLAHSASDLYVVGSFSIAGGSSANRIAKWDTISLSWSALGTGLGLDAKDLLISGSDLYVVGSFITAGGSSANRIAKWDTISLSWSALSGGIGQTGNCLALSGSDLYVGANYGTFDGSIIGGIAKWDTISESWSPLGGGIPGRVTALAVSGNDIYVGGIFTTVDGFSVAAKNVAKWNTVSNTWSALGSGLNSSVNKFVVSGSDVYAGGNFTTSGSYVSKWDGTNWSAVGKGHNGSVASLILSGSDIYAAGSFYVTGSKISRWNGTSWSKIYQGDTDFQTFSNQYFSQSFSASDFSFSTLDNGLQRTTEIDSGKKPFFDSYEDFIEEIRPNTKDYSIIPEFRITEHMDYYINQNDENFLKTNRAFLSLDGAGTRYRSATSETSGFDSVFLKSYGLSDLTKKEEEIRDENAEAELDEVSIKVSGFKKLLPYNGFYPQDRTVQLANLYNEYAEDNLHGGVYNLSYRNDYFNEILFQTSPADIIRDMSVIRHNNYYFIAHGLPQDNASTGKVKIYKTTSNDPTSWSSSVIAEMTGSEPSYSSFGQKIQFISSSVGLNLFIATNNTGTLAGTAGPGYILMCSSSDGITWSTPEPLAVSGVSSTYISGSSFGSSFGSYFEAIHDTDGTQEKIYIVVGSPQATPSAINAAGEAYVVTGTYVSGDWQWGDKTLLYAGDSADDRVGTGASIISCSSGYQLFFGERSGDNPSLNIGNIFVATSSNGNVWSTPTIIASGSQTDSYLGQNNIRAKDFNGKTYVFFSEPASDIDGFNDNGGVFVITSSAGNEWPTSTTYFNKNKLYSRNIAEDYALSLQQRVASISLFSGSDGRLYYAFGNEWFSSLSTDYGEFALGYTDGNGNFQTYENGELFITDYLKTPALIFESMALAVSSYEVGQYSLPIFFIGSYSYVTGIKNNLFTEFALHVSGTEKYYKHAALEPFFAPGILYNTIKSGIAVDWPCATGSNTAIVPYGGNTIVNAYYPQPFQMASYSGSVVQESLYGHLRSNIDYRIPFENLIFPDDAFASKDFLQNDLLERTVLTTLPDDNIFVQTIKEAYIYGGYEPYISPVDFSDIDGLGPKKFSVPFVYRRNDAKKSQLYSLAMSNFLAETVKFFLEGKKMTTFQSKPDNQWKEFDANKTYYMDVTLQKASDLVMMEAWHSDLHPTGSNGEKMNGRYFGYPVNKTDKDLWAGATFTEEESKLIHNDPAYAPYTPPYFEGRAVARMAFKPTNSRSYTLQEVFNSLTVEDIFLDVAKGATTGSDAYINKMPIGSSIDLFGFANPVNVTIDENTGARTIENQTGDQAWIISPRMETPVLNFNNQELVPYQNEYSKTSGFGRGMWSGYGEIPTNGSGIKMKLEYPYLQIRSSLTASLLDAVGFKAEEKTIGKLASDRVVSEAVVVIPYLESATSDTTQIMDGYHFIKLDNRAFAKALVEVRSNSVDEENRTTIISMIEKMGKYVIPPEMNFLSFQGISPFVMYIAEFTHTLDKQDLADIWQGLMPEISYNSQYEEITITHPSSDKEFFGGKPLPKNLRWLVFKVKQKAEADYFKVTANTVDDERFVFLKDIGQQTGTDIYSYNWPYDFFSLVEFAKVQVDLKYKK